MHARFLRDIEYWQDEALSWPCTCRGAEFTPCDRCRVYDALESALDAVDGRDWLSAYEAVARAARVDGRLDGVRSRAERVAHLAEGREPGSDEHLQALVEHWLCETHGWRCTCGGPAMVLCRDCCAHTSLAAAAAAAREGHWEAAHRAARMAADQDGRLDVVRDALAKRAAMPRTTAIGTAHGPLHTYQHMVVVPMPGVGGYPVLSLPRRGPAAPPACTTDDHEAIVSDAILREAELKKVGRWHDADRGVHLQLAHHHCGSTLAWPLPGHREAA
jgi:hypothetical protein